MKLTTVKNKITHRLDVPGLLAGSIEYEIKSGTSKVEWNGPKIDGAVWAQVLAFFRSVYDSSKSECQVRLYCNTITKVWAAWAYPQEARSNMEAKEIDNEEKKVQRAQFAENQGWQYLGTVHHHCAATAFQSGVDRLNEMNQDGLHITIGNMDKPQYDIHARFYLDGTEFIPDLAAFWDIGPVAKQYVPPACYDTVARHQMTTPPLPDTAFPEQWRANLIEIKPAYTPVFWQGAANGGAGAASASVGSGVYGGEGQEWSGLAERKRKEHALAQVRRVAKVAKVEPESLDAVFSFLTSELVVKFTRQAARDHQITIFDILDEWQDETDQLAMWEHGQ